MLVGLVGEHSLTSGQIILRRLLISSLIITILELGAGLILNVELGLNVWDYSSLKFNLIGQISLEYSILWFFLSFPAIIFYDYIRHWLFQEERPIYRLI